MAPPIDRISKLPDELLSEIFFHMPLRDALNASLVSKRWGRVWTTNAALNLQNNSMMFEETKKLKGIVQKVVDKWKGEGLRKFKFESCYELQSLIYGSVNDWVSFAMDHNVEELYLHMMLESIERGSHEPKEDEVYSLPRPLFKCQSVQVLSFRHCIFSLPKGFTVCWGKLKSLTITQGFGITSRLIRRILSGSPQLEVLIFSFPECKQSFTISSESLKVLSIEKYMFEPEDLCLDSKLRIETPRLESLIISGVPYNHYVLKNISSLKHATLEFSGLHCLDELDEWDIIEHKYKEYSFPQSFVGHKLSQVLENIHQLAENVNVTLFCCCHTVVAEATKNRSEQPFFPNVKFLKIGCCVGNYPKLVRVLPFFPQLETLVLQNDKEYCFLDHQFPIIHEYPNQLPDPFLLQLRTFYVTWDKNDSLFAFLKIVLRRARKLQKMVLRVEEIGASSSDLLTKSKKILRKMRRSSRNPTKLEFVVMPRLPRKKTNLKNFYYPDSLEED